MKKRNSTRVYSTENNGLCLGCCKPVAKCICPNSSHSPEGDGIVRLFRETKGRKGKGVTLVKGLPLTDKEMADLAKKLKSACGVGGSTKAGVIELQSADREKVKQLLEQAGFTVKIAGG